MWPSREERGWEDGRGLPVTPSACGIAALHDKLSDTQLTVGEIAVAVEEAAARGTYVTVHAHNNAGIRNAVTAGVRCVEHGSQLGEETAALMAGNDLALVSTLTTTRLLWRTCCGIAGGHGGTGSPDLATHPSL